MKRILSTLLLVAILTVTVLGSLTSCGGGGGGVAPDFVMPEGGLDTSKQIEITFYHSMGQALRRVLDTAIEDFNKLYPNITVKHTSLGNYESVRDTVKNEIAVGDAPNIAYCYPDHVALYNEALAVQTLDALMRDPTYGFTQKQLDDFVPAWLEEGRAFGDGKMYSLPLSKSTEVLYYNKTYFDANGLQPPKTWDEMEAVCRAIKAKEGVSCIPLGYDSESNWFITMCEQYGSPYTSVDGEQFLFDNETNRAFVEKFRGWYEDGLVITQELNGSYTSNLFTANSSSTHSYMCIGSTGGATYQQASQMDGKYDFEVGIAQIPQIDPSKPKVISQGPSVCIFKQKDPQEVLASWLFVKFLTTDYIFQGSVSKTNGYAPVTQSILTFDKYKEWYEAEDATITARSVKAALEQANAYYASPAFLGSSVARDEVGQIMITCFSEKNVADVKAFIKQVFEDAVDKCKYESGQ